MNNNESLRTILELQGIIRNLGIPHGAVFAYQEQLQNIGTIVKSPLFCILHYKADCLSCQIIGV